MIGRLTGSIVTEDVDSVVLDVGGVGYEITVPLGTAGRAARPDGISTFHVHTHVREDQLTLFGFATLEDRAAFRALIGVSNVGPKTAIAVLSALPAEELVRAITKKDVARLTAISGVGKKTAERLVLELKDKLEGKIGMAATPSPPMVATRPLPGRDLVQSALVHMGYKPAEATRALETMGDRTEALPVADAIKEALALLAK